MKRLLLVIALCATQVQAEIYKSVTADGEVIYTDKPVQGAEQLQMPELPTYSPPPLPQRSYREETAPEKQAVYEQFEIVSPGAEEVVWNNLGILNVEARLSPPLRNKLNHRVQFYLDDNPYGAAQSGTSLTMEGLDRGQHTVSAAVVDATGKTLIATRDVIVHMKHHSILNNPQNRK